VRPSFELLTARTDFWNSASMVRDLRLKIGPDTRVLPQRLVAQAAIDAKGRIDAAASTRTAHTRPARPRPPP